MKIKILKPGNVLKREPEKRLIGFRVHCNQCNCDFIMPIGHTHTITMMTFWEYAWNCPWCGSEHQTGQGGYNGKTEYLYEGDI